MGDKKESKDKKDKNKEEKVKGFGQKRWLIPDGFYPEKSNGDFPSHEAICVLNTSDTDAHLNITLYFEDRDKMTGFKAVCKAERTNHIRLDKIKNENGEGIPQMVPYALLVESDVDVVIQYSRMDTSQAEMALMTTIAWGK